MKTFSASEDKMERLVNTVQQLSMVRDIESVMKIVRTEARALTGADGATFVLREEDHCYYADEDAISKLWKGMRFPIDTCISGWTMQNKKPAIIPDIYKDERIPTDAYSPTFVKSLVMVPIRKMDPLGAIGNYWAVHHKPTEKEVSLLQSLADITAVSIENIEIRNLLELKVEQRTEELSESLERQTHLNELKSQLVSMASHELKTPLASMKTSVSVLSRLGDEISDEEKEKYHEYILKEINNLKAIVNDFLSLGQIENENIGKNIQVVHLCELADEVRARLKGVAKPDQFIKLDYSGKKEIKQDRRILKNVLMNLLSNAIKYSEKNIRLDIRVSETIVRIKVSDKGVGIPSADQKHIFNKFFRASNSSSVSGTGLGLNIVKHYVDLLGGQIGFESEEGKGTTFFVEFPSESSA